MTRDGRAMLYGLGAVGLWSTVATAFKVGLAHMSPLTLLWIAAVLTLYTGFDYFRAGLHHLVNGR